MFEFFIERASAKDDRIAPCEGAFLARDLSEDLFGPIWKIRFETLEELMAFISREGQIVIGPDFNEDLSITIYDDYLE